MASSLPLPLAACLCLANAGCASFPPPPLAAEGVAAATVEGLTADPAPVLRLRPGDVLQVEAETTPEAVSWETRLDAQGMAYLSKLGSVPLEGLTLSEAEARLEARMRELDRLAVISVQVAEAGGQRATVLGAVVQQGSIVVTPGMRVSQLIAASGGVLTTTATPTAAAVSLADLSRALLSREGKPLPIDVARALRGDPRHDVFVHAGDHLFVPRRDPGSVSILGQVGTPSVLPVDSELRMTEALARAGGITSGGDKSDIRLLRGPVEAPSVFRADLAAIVDGDAPDVRLQPGDVLFVTDDPVEDIGEVIGLLAPIATLSTSAVLTALLVASQ